MTFERNNTAGDFETMLRRHLEQANRIASPGSEPCSQFDAEVASAYLEGALQASSKSNYESHLANCAGCRHSLVMLHRLTPTAIFPANPAPRPMMDWWQSIKDAISLPGWRYGLVATASVVVALFGVYAVKRQLSSSTISSPAADIAMVERAPASAGTSVATASPPSVSGGVLRSEARVSPADHVARARGRNETSAPTTPPPAMAGSVGGVAAPQQIADVRPVPTQDSDVRLGGQVPGRQMIPPAQQEPKPEAMKQEVAQRQDAPKAPEPASVAASGSERPVSDAGARRLAPAAKSAKPQATPTPRSSEDENFHALVHKVRDKAFRFDRGVWIDQDYKPENRLERIRLTRASVEYERVLTEIPSLAPFFDLGQVIVIWKGKVYEVRK